MNDLLKRVFSAPDFDADLEEKLEDILESEDPWAEAAKLLQL